MDLQQHSDEDLLVLAREDALAFGVLYRRHVRAVHGYFRRRVFDVEAVFDLTAETFAAALRAVPRYEPGPAPARAWLFGIARNTLSEAVRHGRVQDRARRALAMQPIVLDDADVAMLELLAETPAVEALASLPDEQRAAVKARHVDGDSYAEIAGRLECSQSVARQRVSRGLRAMRTRLEEGR
ncbi:MAG: RNA polymerase sigma factor [Solirubrobacteraceae bacterium]|nr:RNA polymerase sigma factor [Solirubrobacteraceae bacterium]